MQILQIPIKKYTTSYPTSYPTSHSTSTQQVTLQVTPQVTPRLPPQVTPQVTPQDEMSKNIVDFCNEPRTKREIADKCGLKDLDHLKDRYLNPLLEQKLLFLTIPEKPSSSKQKYVANPSREESVRFDDPSNVTN